MELPELGSRRSGCGLGSEKVAAWGQGGWGFILGALGARRGV